MSSKMISLKNVFGKVFFSFSITFVLLVFSYLSMYINNDQLLIGTIIFTPVFLGLFIYEVVIYFQIRIKNKEYTYTTGRIIDKCFGLFGLSSLVVEFLDESGQKHKIRTGAYFWINNVSDYIRNEYTIGYIIKGNNHSVIIVEKLK